MTSTGASLTLPTEPALELETTGQAPTVVGTGLVPDPRKAGFTEVDHGEGLAAAVPADRNPYAVYLAALPSRESERVMRGALDRIAALITGAEPRAGLGQGLPWWRLRHEHTAGIQARLMRQTGPDGRAWSPAYVNVHLTALRRVLRRAWLLGLMTADDYERAVDIQNMPGTRTIRGRHLAEQEVAALLGVCLADASLAGARDAALVAVLRSTGVRRAEAAALAEVDYEPGERDLRILGKGNHERFVHLHEVAAVYLGAWLALDERPPGALFCRIDRWGAPRGGHLSGRAIGDIVGRRRRQARLPKLTAHDFRRSLAGELLDRDVDLARVQKILGHVSPITTAAYDRRPMQRRREAIALLTLPRPEELA